MKASTKMEWSYSKSSNSRKRKNHQSFTFCSMMIINLQGQGLFKEMLASMTSKPFYRLKTRHSRILIGSTVIKSVSIWMKMCWKMAIVSHHLPLIYSFNLLEAKMISSHSLATVQSTTQPDLINTQTTKMRISNETITFFLYLNNAWRIIL